MLDKLIFYKATDEFNTYEKHISAPYLRTEFKTDADKKYKITVSGLGFYDLFINGEMVTKGLLAPYISNPDDIVYFDEYDISSHAKNGGNICVGLILGNGMQNAPGGGVWDFDKAIFRNVPCFALALTSSDENGEDTIDIGSRFKTHPSPIIFDDLRSGCFYDARAEIPGWDLPGFDDSGWSEVKKADTPRGERRLCDAAPILVEKEIKAVEIKKTKLDPRFNNRENMRADTQFKFNGREKTGVMYDFGINTSGVCKLKIDSRPGQEIFIQFCELKTLEGLPSYNNAGSFYPDGYGQTIYYICRGGSEEFIPSFCYFGFRYAVIFGLDDDQIKDDTLVMLRAHSDLKENGGFRCSDEIMNKLGEIVRNSDLSNFWYFPTDCPFREKNGWTGDAAVSAEHVLLNLTPEKSYREWLRNICKAQRKDGSLPGIVPTGGWGFEWGNGPAWDNVLSELCWQIYRLRGDIEPARECSDSLFLYLNYLTKLRDEKGLISYGLGDWLQPGRGAGDPVAPVILTSSVISCYIAYKSEMLFGALGLEMQRKFAASLKESLRESVRKEFIDFDTFTVRPRCQTAQAICIYYGIFDESEKQAAGRVLESIVHESGDRIDCGMMGLRVIFHVLSDLGLGNLAYKMITREDYPSYGMFVRRGETSLPESFITDEDYDWSDSLNHHFFGDISSWFIQRVAGIRINPQNLSSNAFVIRPDIIDALGSAEAFYDAPCGRLSVKWERSGDKVSLEVTAPEGASGMVAPPQGYAFEGSEDLGSESFDLLGSGKTEIYTFIKNN